MAKQNPVQIVEAQHGSKDKLLDKVVDLLERGDESREEMKERLKGVSNAKLLRLLEVAQTVKEKFGSKEKLVDAILAMEKRGKDKDYRAKLLAWPPARLLDRHGSAEKHSRGAAA